MNCTWRSKTDLPLGIEPLGELVLPGLSLPPDLLQPLSRTNFGCVYFVCIIHTEPEIGPWRNWAGPASKDPENRPQNRSGVGVLRGHNAESRQEEMSPGELL
jgi:hypothetical protein